MLGCIQGDTVKLCDFGWAVYCPDKEMRSTLCGTPLYLAPELVSQQEYDNAIDIWAIGVLTYEILTEKSPFHIQTFEDLSRIVGVIACSCGRKCRLRAFATRQLEISWGRRLRKIQPSAGMSTSCSIIPSSRATEREISH